MEYSTGLKLLDFPDAKAPRGGRIYNSGATRCTISNSGKRYTFFIRKGLPLLQRHSGDARHYAYALNRALGRELQSPAFQFISDTAATNIVGAAAVRAGGAQERLRYSRGRRRLIVNLTKASPVFLSQLTMPFFQAQHTSLSRNNEVINEDDRNDLPSAGPYYIATRRAGQSITMRRNPFYKEPRGREPQRHQLHRCRSTSRRASTRCSPTRPDLGGHPACGACPAEPLRQEPRSVLGVSELVHVVHGAEQQQPALQW